MAGNISFPRFISNAPCGRDLYESGSQDKTAKSISEHIKSDSSGYKLIGMDGEWGSGKSNAISIIETQLGENYHTFIYDAWAHQEDLQKRSFLEELTDNLQKKHIIDQTKWKAKLKSLLAKKKENIKKTIPKLSTAIVASILVVVLLPFSSALSALFDKAYLKIIVTAIPLIVALGLWLYIYYKNKKRIPLLDLFYIYQHKDLEEVTEETISEDEPSNRKFREWMMDLSGDLQKNVIIVFDNMDRLPTEKVQIIWALIHTFFSSQTYPKISVIVPFDRTHIRDAFGNEEKDKDFEKTNHFITKTFPVIFNISPAILTDWKYFFEKKYEEAFGDTEKGEYIITRKIFDLYNTSITPRKIISFINDLVSLKLIWKKEIKLRYIALFVLNKQQIAQNPLPEILNKEFLNRSHNLFTGDDDVSDNIASLLYNIPLEKAAQVSLSRQIEVAIRERRINDLKEFSKNPDFVSILEQIPTEDIEIEATTTCLNEIEPVIEKINSESLQIIWDRLLGKQLKINLDSLAFTEVHKILISKARDHQLKPLVRYLAKQFYHGRDFSGSKYFNALNNLEEFIAEKGLDVDLFAFVEQKEVAPEVFVDYLESADNNYKRYKVSSNNDLLESYYLEKIPGNLEACIGLGYLKGQYKFPGIKTELEKIIKHNNVTLDNLALIFHLYKSVNPTTYLTARLGDEKILELLTAASEKSAEYYELVAMRLAKGKSFPTTPGKAQDILNLVDESLVNEVSNLIQYYNTYGTLLLEVIEWPQPLLKSILKKLTLTDLGRSMSIENILPKFKEIISAIDVTPNEMLNKLNAWNKYLKEKLTPNTLDEIIPDYSFYAQIETTDNDLTKTIWTIAVQFIEQASPENWGESFKDRDSYFFNLLCILLKSNRINNLPDNAFSAYKDTLKAVTNSADEYDISSEAKEYWMLLYNKSDKIHLQPTIKDIRDIFLRDIDISEEQFLYFEPLLREQADMLEKSGDVVRKILVPILSNGDCLSALLANSDFYASIIISAGNDAFDFIDTLREKIEADSDNVEMATLEKKINDDLAKSIKIKYAKYYSSNKDDSEAIEITESLKRIVEKEKQLHFKVDNGIVNGEDPDEGNQKNLYVKYTYKGEEKEKTFDEHKWLRLP